MRFYLGTHEPAWLPRTEVPLFVSLPRLARRKALPRALGRWALDSGGFTELHRRGGWTRPPGEYIELVRRYRDEIGGLDWASPQDWMCEASALRATGRTVRDHQRLTTENLVELRTLAPDLPFIPVVQGQQLSDYLRHVDRYARAGIELDREPLVGVGSICRRQHTEEAREILGTLAGLGLRLHGFGLKRLGLRACANQLTSADSMAWSFRARKHRTRLGHGCKHPGSCANCMTWALAWRSETLHHVERAEASRGASSEGQGRRESRAR